MLPSVSNTCVTCRCGWRVYSQGQRFSIKCFQCGQVVTSEGFNPGLGDHIASIIDACGGRIYKRAYRWLFRKECGCNKRQAKLNRWWNRITALHRSLTSEHHSTDEKQHDTE